VASRTALTSSARSEADPQEADPKRKGAQYELSCAARALDNAVYLASANQIGQIGVYPGASFGAAGGVYGPDGTLVSEGVDVSGGVLGIAEVDPGFPERWRGFYGDPVLERRNLSLEACS
jgi:predicted amidohydrolase